MKRSKFIRNAVIGAAGSTAAACSPIPRRASQGTGAAKVQWRMATSWPGSLDTISGGATRVCDRVSAMTDGRFEIKPFEAGEIVPGPQVLDAVQSGTVQCGHTASYYYIGKNPALGFATSVPFGLTAQQQNAWLYHGGGLKAIQDIYADFGVINFPAGNTGTQMGGWFKRQIQSVADLKGLKMRIPGLGGEVMSRLGVNVQLIPGGEIFLALERGTIDAAEWVGPYDDEKLGLHKAAPYYYYPGWWEPGATLDVLVNRSDWDKLPTEYQEVFKTAAYEANINMLAQYDALNREALGRLTAGGTKLARYSDDILKAAQEKAFELYAENAAKNSDFRRVYEPWTAFREQVYQWHQVNEISFANFVTAQTKR
ncbi:Monocarboxylate 2-oxoacid-binding periplasmic protein [Acaryochloris thomasi RCC1774]|uniref:Monocarboxylate 2-oxoacid-binding periplasmic protein n=1 Tax=Acaryochloris thomasi RCC1774 TaxID=1764569 RepID=A0A2W1JZ92_9CYAN|nr:TRAP transporter substrate-binding protein [Acaryochloris thomasi]PZD73791.1 Monocarboxylate 2-oxoacid-binding periplasmic protein [Acaryochloris thomasi RCC1774]